MPKIAMTDPNPDRRRPRRSRPDTPERIAALAAGKVSITPADGACSSLERRNEMPKEQELAHALMWIISALSVEGGLYQISRADGRTMKNVELDAWEQHLGVVADWLSRRRKGAAS